MTDSSRKRAAQQQVEAALQIDSVCDAFEQSWLSGAAPRIEDHLGDATEPVRSTLLLELLKVELHYRIRNGERPGIEEYVDRFPEHSETLADADLQAMLVAERGTPEWEPGKQLAQFDLLEKLGTGAFGAVWKARDNLLGRIVAVKLPHAAHGDERAGSLLLREAQAAAQLKHSGIVSILEVGTCGETTFIVSELIDGIDLKQWLRENEPTFEQAAHLCLHLAEALQHAHEQGVIHRDLKPANILLDRENLPHIADFGLAKRLSAEVSLTRDGQVMGTPSYMSPEQAKGDAKRVDARTDLYSAGVILYEMITGRRPFEGDEREVLRQVAEADPPAPRQMRADVPRDLETICLKAMAKPREQRYATAADLASDLRRFLEGRPVQTRRPKPVRSRHWLNRRQFTTAALGALPFSGLFLWSRLGPRPEPGSKLVTIDTDPPGAEIWFIPLHPFTGEPQPERIVAAGTSPVEAWLLPGDYLVEAVLSEQQFHEVYRRVPGDPGSLQGGYGHLYSRPLESGAIFLPQVRIPPADVGVDMALIEGSSNFEMGKFGSTIVPQHVRHVPSFLVDSFEATIATYKQINGGRLPPGFAPKTLTDDDAIPLGYDDAVSVAEILGKRLPHEAEYEFVATWGGQRDFPWGASLPAEEAWAGLSGVAGRVGEPSFDCVRLDRRVPVYGLCSNLGEWTTCLYATHYPRDGGSELVRHAGSPGARIMRGGALPEGTNLQPGPAPGLADPRMRIGVQRTSRREHIGLRCYRSPRPRLTADDFVQIVPTAPRAG